MKKTVSPASLWIMALALVHSCVYADSKPDWVDGESESFPYGQFITATGSASKAELAKDRALANLVKIFELKIQEESITRSDTRVNIKDGEESFTKSDRLEQQISVRTDKVIDGARIAESWHDEEVFVYHALAVLERKQAGNNIRQEMLRLDDETETELSQVKKLRDPLRVMAGLNRALDNQRQRLSLQRMLKVIDLSGKGRSPQWSLAELRHQLDEALNNLQIATATDSDPIGGLEQALQSAMGNAGVPAVNSGMSNYTMVASLDVQDLGKREGWYWLRGKLSLKLIEASSGKIRARKQWPLKVSALQRTETDSRLMTQVSKVLNKDLKAVILSFATGTTEN